MTIAFDVPGALHRQRRRANIALVIKGAILGALILLWVIAVYNAVIGIACNATIISLDSFARVVANEPASQPAISNLDSLATTFNILFVLYIGPTSFVVVLLIR